MKKGGHVDRKSMAFRVHKNCQRVRKKSEKITNLPVHRSSESDKICIKCVYRKVVSVPIVSLSVDSRTSPGDSSYVVIAAETVKKTKSRRSSTAIRHISVSSWS